MSLNNIIDLADIKEVRAVSSNIDEASIDPYISEAQSQELQPLLGPAFYLAFVTDIDGGSPSPENTKLFEGGTYESGTLEIFFRGVKEFLSYATFSRFVIRNNQQVTRFGVVQREVPESSPVSSAMANQERLDARAVMQGVQREISDFLDSQSSDYPLWRRRSTTPTKQSFRFDKVPRNIRP